MSILRYLADHPADAEVFHARIRGASRRVGRLLAEEHDWRGTEHVIDIGGGSGGVLAELHDRHRR